MQKWKSLWGVRTWIGCLAAVVTILALNACGALLMTRGTIPETPLWVYGAYGLGALIGNLIAARGGDGALLRAAVMAAVLFALACLCGAGVYGGITLRQHGGAIAAALLCGGMCGALLAGVTAGKGRGAGMRKKRR